MNVYIHWENGKAHVFDREKFLMLRYEEFFLVKKEECFECPIFNKENKKCTHPKMGCDASELRIEPWTKWVKCPIKLSKDAAQAQKS